MGDHWVAEFIADSLGFYTIFAMLQSHPERARLEYARLQMAVELFFHVLMVLYGRDVGTDTHPSPMMRAAVIRARRRRDHHVDWDQFLSGIWGPGFVASMLLEQAVRKASQNPE